MGITGIGKHFQNKVYEEKGIQNIAESKYMDKITKGESINLLQEMTNGVSIEISEEGKKIIQKMASVEQEGTQNMPASYEERIKLLQEAIKPAQKLHRIIPNIQTNDKLEKSLKGANENLVDAAYSIIYGDLIPHNVGELTEDERKELIFVGLEKAKFLAECLEYDKADSFMDAMNTIAKYGINGKTDEQGNITYDIRWGAMTGAPDDYISSGELMQRIAPKQYKTYLSMQNEAIEKNDERLALKAVKFAIDWEINTYRTNPKPFEDIKAEQVNWKKNVDNTKINSNYTNTNKLDMDCFIKSVLEQNKVLNADYLSNNLKEYAKFFK